MSAWWDNNLNNNCIIYDARSKRIYYFINGEEAESGEAKAYDEVLNYCFLRGGRQTITVVLIGQRNETEQLYQELRKYRNFVVCRCVSNSISEPSPKAEPQSVKVDMSEMLKSLSQLTTLIKEERSQSVQQIESIKHSLNQSLVQILDGQKELKYYVGEIYDHGATCSGGGNSEVVNSLRKELEIYKNDFFQKSMLRYGVNVMIDIIKHLYAEKYLLRKQHIDGDEYNRICQIISFCEAHMKKLNLQTKSSQMGEEFDGERMKAYDDIETTEDVNLKGRVAYSISPAIYWTLPRVNAPGEDKLLLEEEIVSLYE